MLLGAEGEIGGDCTFTGCVPSKTLIAAVAVRVPFSHAMARVRATVAGIAAGEDKAVLRRQGIEGLAETPYLTTDTIFALTSPPDSLAVLGGGAVGCELAQAFARLAEVFAAEGITVHTGTKVVTVCTEAGRILLHTASGQTVSAQQLLVAVGRRPATADLGSAHPSLFCVDTGEQGRP